MRLNEYELEFLFRFLGRIDIKHIPIQGFLIAIVLHERLGRILAGEEREAS
jgi:hypothetical protein